MGIWWAISFAEGKSDSPSCHWYGVWNSGTDCNRTQARLAPSLDWGTSEPTPRRIAPTVPMASLGGAVKAH